jgi:hypothetical protein
MGHPSFLEPRATLMGYLAFLEPLASLMTQLASFKEPLIS